MSDTLTKEMLEELFYRQFISRIPKNKEPFLASSLGAVINSYGRYSRSGYIQDVIDTANGGASEEWAVLSEPPYREKNSTLIGAATIDKEKKMHEVISGLFQSYLTEAEQ